MPEGYHEQVAAERTKIESLQKDKDAPRKLKEYSSSIASTAINGERELAKLATSLTSGDDKKNKDIKTYLDSSVPQVTGFLGDIAQKGFAIIDRQKSKQDIGAEHYQPIDRLHGSLKAELAQQKNEIGIFGLIEKCDEENKTLDATRGSAAPDQLIAREQDILKKLPQSTGVSSEYKNAVEKSINDNIALLQAFIADKTKVKSFSDTVNGLTKPVTEYEKNPTPENLAIVKQQQSLLDSQKVSDEIFGNKLGGSETNLTSGMYQQLWNGEFSAAKSALDGLNSRVDAKEGEWLTANADKMVTDVLANEKAVLAPQYEQYAQLALRTTIDDKGEKDQFLQSEEALLNGYLVLKSTVGTFSDPQTLGKLKFEIQQKVQESAKNIDTKIRQIEVNRETRKSRESLSKTNIFSYVDFLGKEKNGKIYKFNTTYDTLSPEKKEDVRMAVEALVSRDHGTVQADTYQTTLKLARASGNFDRMREKLGEKSKSYFDGLKLMTQGKFPESLASFKAYIQLSTSFSADEKTAQKSAIDDANSRIEIMGKSADYSEGLRLLKSNDNDGAEIMFKKYLTQTESMPEDAKKSHAEQIRNARELIKLSNNKKITQLQDLLTDVKTWKEFQIKDQIDSRGVKHNVEVEGPEVMLIEQNINDLRARVAKGEMLDFKTEMRNIKTRATEYNRKNSFKPEDNVIDKLSSLYEKFNNADPKEKQKAYVEFATELRDCKSYGLARKYLDKSLQEDYRAAAPNVSKEKILQGMLDDPKMMATVRAQAHQYFERFKKENPGADTGFSQEKAEQLVINRTLNTQYSRELRKEMTDRGQAGSNPALALYNDYSPYVTREHFWQAGAFDAETYDQFKDEFKENVAMTVATLPVGMAAGAIGKGAGALIFRGVTGKLLSQEAMTAAVTAVERGGIMAIQPGSAAFSALEPAVQQMIIANSSRLALAGGASFIGGVALEGATLFLGNDLAQGFVTGQSGGIDGEHIFESIVKAAIFRGIGAGGTKMFGNAMKAGGVKGAAALAGMEAFSGAAGTTVEAAGLYAAGNGKEVDTAFVLKTLVQNAMSSAGTHLAHGVIELPGRVEGPGRAGKKMLAAEQKVPSANATEAPVSEAIPLVRKKQPTPASEAITGKIPRRENPTINERGGMPIFKVENVAAATHEVVDIDKLRPVIIKMEIEHPELLNYELLLKAREDHPELFPNEIRNRELRKIQHAFEKNQAVDVNLVKLQEEMSNAEKTDKAAINRMKELNKQENGKDIILDEVADGKLPLTKELVDKMINGRMDIARLETFLSDPDVKLSWKLDPGKLIETIREKQNMIHNQVELKNIRESMAPEEFPGEVAKAIARVESGQPMDVSDKLGEILKNVATRNPETYKALLKSDIEKIASTECLNGIIAGNKIEFVDTNGKKITAYTGKDIGKGGYGMVAEVAYMSEGSDKLQYAVVKTPHENTKDFFYQEVAGATEIKDWNHPHIIKPLHVGEDYIVYETGEGAMDLNTAPNKVNVKEWMGLFRDVMDGSLEYQRRGLFHGDLKEANVLTFMETGADGKPHRVAKLIDNAPTAFDKIADTKWQQTTYYSISEAEFRTTATELYRQGKNYKEMIDWVARAVDARAQAIIMNDAIDYYSQTVPAEGRAILESLRPFIIDAYHPVQSGNPEFMKNFRAEIDRVTNQLGNYENQPAKIVMNPGEGKILKTGQPPDAKLSAAITVPKAPKKGGGTRPVPGRLEHTAPI